MNKELTRYGLEWNGPTNFLARPMDDGYWTPWHEAQQRIAELEAELAEEKRVALYHEAQAAEIYVELADIKQEAEETNQKWAFLAWRTRAIKLEAELTRTEYERHMTALERDGLRAELAEQCRLHGIGSEREARLMARVEESQATIAKLREALENLHALVEGECPSLLKDDHHDMMVREALALPQDRTELAAALAESRRKWMLEAAEICKQMPTYIGSDNGCVEVGAGACAEAIRQAAERKK